MTIRLSNPELLWIKQEYESGRTIQEIATDTSISISNIKRALAESNVIDLDWYKTKNEINMLKYLKSKGISNLQQLKEII